jgi:hypothetical protein
MKNATLILALLFSVSCGSNESKNNLESTDTKAIESTAPASFGQLFTGAPYQQDGEGGCVGTYNSNWQKYFSYNTTSMTMSTGDSCNTVDTKTNSSCVFSLGSGGITQISFDFKIDDACHNATTADWLSFWIYSEVWSQTVEVDFIETQNGPAMGGLNSNFAGMGTQVAIFDAGVSPPVWEGSIIATFSLVPSTDQVNVSVSNSVNSNVATSTLTRSTGYFFVMDSTPSQFKGCSFTISNLKAEGTVSSGQCNGIIVQNIGESTS